MSLRKIAFFVEGLTEQLFVEKLLVEILGQNKIAVEVKKIEGGAKTAIKLTAIASPTINHATDYYVLIFDCGGDSSIGSYIKDQRNSLISSGYSKIIGMRDVFPDFKRSEIPLLRKHMYYGIPQKDILTKFILSIMEVESWFLAEENHYNKINTTLNIELIEKEFGFNPLLHNTEDRDEPANDLKRIYNHVGASYSKNRASIERTIDALDYCNLYLAVNKRNHSLNELISEINEFVV